MKKTIWIIVLVFLGIVRQCLAETSITFEDVEDGGFYWTGGTGDLGGKGDAQKSTIIRHGGNCSVEMIYDFSGLAVPVPDYYFARISYLGGPLPGQPSGCNVWIYGDGSYRTLSYRYRDQNGRIWQSTLGQISWTGWEQKSLPFDLSHAHWGGTGLDTAFNYPIEFSEFVLNGGVPGVSTSSGSIYFDDLVAVTTAPENDCVFLSRGRSGYGNNYVGSGNPEINFQVSNISSNSRIIKIDTLVRSYFGEIIKAETQNVNFAPESTQTINMGIFPQRGYYTVEIKASQQDIASPPEKVQKISSAKIPEFGSSFHDGTFSINTSADPELIKKLGASYIRADVLLRPFFVTGAGSYNASYWQDIYQRINGAGLSPWALVCSKGFDTYGSTFLERKQIWLNEISAFVNNYYQYVKYYDIWNEPEYTWNLNWGNQTQFGDMCVEAHNLIKSLDSDAKTMYCSSHSDFSFESNVLQGWTIPTLANQSSPKFPFDILSVHPYTNPSSPEAINLRQRMLNCRSWLDANGGTEKELWVSEVGYSTVLGNEDWSVTEENQAAYMVRNAVLSLSAGAKKFNLYVLHDWYNAYDPQHCFGLFRYGTNDPKPSAAAFAQMALHLDSSTYKGAVDLGLSNGECYLFENNINAVAVMWLKVEDDSIADIQTFLPESAFIERIDGSCAAVSDPNWIRLSKNPVYVFVPLSDKEKLYQALKRESISFFANFNSSLTPDITPTTPILTYLTRRSVTNIGSPAFTIDTSIQLGGGALRAISTGICAVKYNSSNFKMTGAGTIEFWIRPNWNGNSTGSNVFFHAHGDSYYTQQDIQISRTGSSLDFTMFFDTIFHFKTTSADISSWQAGEWHHVVCAWNGLDNSSSTFNLRLYVDGQFVTQSGWFTGETMLQDMHNVVVGGNLDGAVSGAITGITRPHNNADAHIDDFQFVPYCKYFDYGMIDVAGCTMQFDDTMNVCSSRQNYVAENINSSFNITHESFASGGGSLDASSTSVGAVKYNVKNFPMTGQGTIEFWISPNWGGNSSGTNVFFHAHGDPYYGRQDIQISRTGSSLDFTMFFDTAFHFKSISADISAWQPGEWHYVACCWDGLDSTSNTFNLSIYVDGNWIASPLSFSGETMLGPVQNAVLGGNLDGAVTEAISGITRPHYNAEALIDSFRFNAVRKYWGTGSHVIP